MVCDVAIGKPHEATTIDESLSSPPDGCNSVHGRQDPGKAGTLNHEEFVVYDNDAALPKYILFY